MSPGLYLRAKTSQVFRLGQVVQLLKMSAADLDAHLAEAAQENPMLVLRSRRAAPARSATDVLEMTAIAETNSLYDHVFRALAGLIGQGGLMERVVTALISELEPSGWLARSPQDIAADLGLGVDLIDAALAVIQKRIDPPGLFARNLEDCLRLQLEDRGEMTAPMALVLAHLAALERGGVAALVAASGLDPATVQQCLTVIRRLDPKPGNSFASDPALLREPDVRISPEGDGWEIEFLSSLQNDIQIAAVPRGGHTSETRAALARARALKQALEIRRSALEQVVHALVERQGAFFRDGPAALVPLTLSEIATATGFHLSTVSRVLNGLLIEGPNGITAARALFSGAVSAGAIQSKAQVQARIRALLAKEDPKRPISDKQLTAILQDEGVAVSHRVVSNYRHEIGILAPAKRRLRA